MWLFCDYRLIVLTFGQSELKFPHLILESPEKEHFYWLLWRSINSGYIKVKEIKFGPLTLKSGKD